VAELKSDIKEEALSIACQASKSLSRIGWSVRHGAKWESNGAASQVAEFKVALPVRCANTTLLLDNWNIAGGRADGQADIKYKY
jgi:hypothetical protein